VFGIGSLDKIRVLGKRGGLLLDWTGLDIKKDS